MKKQLITYLFLALVCFITFQHTSSSPKETIVEDSDIDTVLYHVNIRKNNQKRKAAFAATTPPRSR